MHCHSVLSDLDNTSVFQLPVAVSPAQVGPGQLSRAKLLVKAQSAQLHWKTLEALDSQRALLDERMRALLQGVPEAGKLPSVRALIQELKARPSPVATWRRPPPSAEPLTLSVCREHNPTIQMTHPCDIFDVDKGHIQDQMSWVLSLGPMYWKWTHTNIILNLKSNGSCSCTCFSKFPELSISTCACKVRNHARRTTRTVYIQQGMLHARISVFRSARLLEGVGQTHAPNEAH